jgi:hypothetical protein
MKHLFKQGCECKAVEMDDEDWREGRDLDPLVRFLVGVAACAVQLVVCLKQLLVTAQHPAACRGVVSRCVPAPHHLSTRSPGLCNACAPGCTHAIGLTEVRTVAQFPGWTSRTLHVAIPRIGV